jgi:N utilization substance protein A
LICTEAKELDEDCGDLETNLVLKLMILSLQGLIYKQRNKSFFKKFVMLREKFLFSEFKHREDELITGIVRRYERGNVIVDLGKADAVLARKEIIYGESFNPGDRVQAYLIRSCDD